MIEPSVIGILCLVGVLALIGLRVPVAVALFAVSILGIWAIAGQRVALSMLASVPYATSASWTLSSVPMFLLMGFVAHHAGLTQGLFNAARVWLGALPGGLVLASLSGTSAFAAVTGSSVACSAAIGRIAIPHMVKNRYDRAISAGSVAAGGTIGALIPPSILLIIFAVQARVPITDLFLGGLVVGLVSLVFYVVATLLVYARTPAKMPRAAGRSWADKRRATRDIWPVLLMIFAVFGGLFSGLFTATEAGAVGSLTAIAIGLSRRTLSWAGCRASVEETLIACGSLFVIAIAANLFTRLLALSGVQSEVGALVDDLELSVVVTLLMIAAIYLALGMFLEPIGTMLLTLPLFLPLVEAQGIGLIWFGLFAAKLLEIGMITPPVGLNVFVIHSVTGPDIRVEDIFRGVIPFLLADLALVAAMIWLIAAIM